MCASLPTPLPSRSHDGPPAIRTLPRLRPAWHRLSASRTAQLSWPPHSTRSATQLSSQRCPPPGMAVCTGPRAGHIRMDSRRAGRVRLRCHRRGRHRHRLRDSLLTVRSWERRTGTVTTRAFCVALSSTRKVATTSNPRSPERSALERARTRAGAVTDALAQAGNGPRPGPLHVEFFVRGDDVARTLSQSLNDTAWSPWRRSTVRLELHARSSACTSTALASPLPLIKSTCADYPPASLQMPQPGYRRHRSYLRQADRVLAAALAPSRPPPRRPRGHRLPQRRPPSPLTTQ